MKKQILSLMILTIAVMCVAVFMLSANNSTTAQTRESGNPKVNSQQANFFMTTNRVPNSGTTLSRDSTGLAFTFHTQGLAVGHVVTVWMAIFNQPENCATNPCTPADFSNPAANGLLVNSGGRVIGLDGSAAFGAFRGLGDITGREAGSMDGLINPLRAEIHLVLRDHGVASGDPMILAQQLSMFNGGCPGGMGCANVQVSINQR